jgi:Mitochondrial carrier protein
MVMIQQMKDKSAALPIAQRVLASHPFRGLGLTAGREACFVTGYLALAPVFGAHIAAYNAVHGQDWGETVTRTTGSIAAGLFAGVTSQPFDTTKTVVQSESAATFVSTAQCVRDMVEKKGMQALFRGGVPRGLRIIGAVVIIQEVKVRLEAVT